MAKEHDQMGTVVCAVLFGLPLLAFVLAWRLLDALVRWLTTPGPPALTWDVEVEDHEPAAKANGRRITDDELRGVFLDE